MGCEWDPAKAQANYKKHGIRFSDAATALTDPQALTIRDPFSPAEERWITVGLDALGRVLVLVYAWRGENVRLISARKLHRASESNTRNNMKREYDFRGGKRGAVITTPRGKTRITIRLDDEILGWFREQVERAGGGNYQTLINEVLRRHVESSNESFEKTLRRVIREELRRAS